MGCFVSSGSVVQVRASQSSGEVARAVPAQCKATQHLPFLTDGAHSPSPLRRLEAGHKKGGPVWVPLLAGRQVRVGQL